MSWLRDAQNLIAKRNAGDVSKPSSGDILDDESRLVKELRSLYENATVREIEKAIAAAREKLQPPYTEKELMDFLRVRLED